ncbi:pentapeptide repeat-containing protein [Thalassospira xianhensis]|uniref:Pentapeptide repeat-containing protein n=1 Tax=Thalassospira xianhensis MCCC 1A02616 TaxID=1177929 RepID=A0A367U8J1_9PROT|nr:pentapeptide repeat-containing protein [Thalassospira xianhensis]RCK04341.1 hypothetical protein TH5_20475 [Thalassospira xianhensis MCCC 1A02616]
MVLHPQKSPRNLPPDGFRVFARNDGQDAGLPTTNLSRPHRFYIAKRYFKGHSDTQLHLCETENEIRDMAEESIPKIEMLVADEALDLWRKGRNAWNSWIDRHPGSDINFFLIDFSLERDPLAVLSFAKYRFDNINVNFSYANFGHGEIDFTQASFRNCNLGLSNINFGNGDLNFSRATFGDGDIDLSFATFGNFKIYFSGATFGDGDVNFFRANCGNGDVYFSDVTLGKGQINFCQAQIKDLLFTPKAIGTGEIIAEGLSIKGRAVFDLPSSAIKLKSLNLHSASFDGPLTLKGALSIIPDLRATRYSHQVDLSALTVKLRRRWQKPGRRTDQLRVKAVSETGIISRLAYKFARKKWINLRHFNKLRRLWKHHCWPIKLSQVAEDPQDGARLRRLKEIAETNKDHQAALRFSADENRAKRWIETSWFGSVLDMAFSFFSNYGQSILRPSFWLGVIFALSMYAYKAKQLPKLATDGWADWAQAALLSASNSLPFLPQSRELRTGALKALYDTTDPSSYVDALMITQGVLSFIFLFLIGLGLRNRFRL